MTLASLTTTWRPRLRRILLSRPALIVGGLLLVYLLASWFAFEPLVKWAAPKFVAERGGYRLAIERARYDPLRLAIELRGIALNEPAGKPLLAMERFAVDFEASSLFRRAWTFAEIRLERPVGAVELGADGRLNWLAFVDAFAGPADTSAPAEPGPPPRLIVQRFVLDRGRVDFADLSVPGGFRVPLDPLDLDLEHLSTLPDDLGQHAFSARIGIGAQVRWRGNFGLNPVTANGDIAVDDLDIARLQPYLAQALGQVRPEGKAALNLSYRAGYADQRVSLQLDQLVAQVEAVALRGPDAAASAAVALDTIALSGGQFDLATRRATFESLAVQGGRVGLVRGADGQLDLERWLTAAAPASVSASAPAAGPAPAPGSAASATSAASAAAAPPPVPAAAGSAPATGPWRVALARASVDGVALRIVDEGFAAPLTAEADALRLAFRADASAGAGPADLDIQGLDLALSGLRLRSGAQTQPWFQLGRFAVEQAHATLSTRSAGIARVTLADGSLKATRDAQGRIDLLGAFDAAAAAPRPAPAPTPAAAASAPAWSYRIDKVEASGFGVSLTDASVQPAAALVLDGITASAEKLVDDPKATVPVQLALAVKSGGRLELRGNVVPAAASADLRVALRGLALSPAQPYLAPYTALQLAGGQVDSEGRLRLAADGQLRYEGGFALRELLVREPGNESPFLAWQHLATKRLVATAQKLEIGELELARLDTRFVIFKDRTINVAQAFHPKAGTSPAAPASAPPAAASAAAASPYAVDIARLRIVDSKLDFADLSLALPFGARIDKLEGQVVGLSTAPGRSAQLELAGQVDEYGLMRANGTLEPGDPTHAMDLKVQFRNVEMTSLTPYSATFAGRKIASGKLSLDLAYQLDRRQLKGDNQVVMDRLTLGERVESPDAMNLPLDLAIALLEDSDGRIDLGLPVSGSLDDPQFSIGGLIGKVILNVLTKIVTAPFRAIGALFGGSGEQAPEIAFDAGTAKLLPPEREKLDKLAQALGKRPGLALTVRGGYSPAADAAALRELQLRRTIAAATGRPAVPGEDPGPIATGLPEVQKAVEALYVQAFGAPALQALRAPPAAPVAGAASVPAGPDLHTRLLQQLRARDLPGEDQLAALATQRAEAIRGQVVTQGVAAERVRLEAPARVDSGPGRAKLDLAVAPRAAASAASAAR
jgi:hypothetical protein